MRAGLFGLILATGSSFGCAQTKQVVDASDGKPLSGVKVSAQAPSFNGATVFSGGHLRHYD